MISLCQDSWEVVGVVFAGRLADGRCSIVMGSWGHRDAFIEYQTITDSERIRHKGKSCHTSPTTVKRRNMMEWRNSPAYRPGRSGRLNSLAIRFRRRIHFSRGKFVTRWMRCYMTLLKGWVISLHGVESGFAIVSQMNSFRPETEEEMRKKVGGTIEGKGVVVMFLYCSDSKYRPQTHN